MYPVKVYYLVLLSLCGAFRMAFSISGEAATPHHTSLENPGYHRCQV